MNKQFLSFFTALGIALLLIVGFVSLRSYYHGITIRLGDDTLPPLAAPSFTQTPTQIEDFLPQGAKKLGIQRVATSDDREEDSSSSFFGPRLGLPGSRLHSVAALRELARMRRNVESDKKPSVPLDGKTVSLLAETNQGGEAVDTLASQWQGPYGGGEEGTFVVSDPISWKKVWQRVSTEPLPSVDFASREVATIFLGYRPTGGFGVGISSAPVETASAMTVFWKEITPRPGRTPPEGATSPFAMRLIPKSSLPIRFEKLP